MSFSCYQNHACIYCPIVQNIILCQHAHIELIIIVPIYNIPGDPYRAYMSCMSMSIAQCYRLSKTPPNKNDQRE